ncbi:PIN domain-containing protein [Breznakiellaceae bacterium SP9]
MSDRVFIDTNILVYAYSTDDEVKQRKTVSALFDNDCVISTQVVNEFCNICLKKLHLSASIIKRDLAEIITICDCYTVNYQTAQHALALQERYGFSYYDCLIVASAIETDCKYLFTEDLSNGQKIDNILIRNIFC